LIAALTFVLSIPTATANALSAHEVAIVSPKDATFAERLAAKEIRRYLYLRTGELPGVVHSEKLLPERAVSIVVGQKDRGVIRKFALRPDAKIWSLESEQYQLKTFNFGKRRVILITGGDSG